MTVEIVLLAMVAVFVGLRLYSVLGRRTGHEQQPVTRPDAGAPVSSPLPDLAAEKIEPAALVYEERATSGIRAIVAADPSFDAAAFLDGAKAAYRMVLEAFWKGDEGELAYLVSDDVRASFAQAIADRAAAGQVLDNRLIRIEQAIIEDAALSAGEATIQVRFDADIAAVTRNADGEVIAGSLSDAVETHDIWTFRRMLGSDDPNWLLVETDEAA